jgi:hypothetical protein
MNATKLLPLSLLALLGAACTTPDKQAPTAAPTAATTVAVAPTTTAKATPVTDEAVPPLFLKVHAPATLGTDVDVDIDVEILRTAPDLVPMQLMVSVPSGAQLVKGLARETITDGTSTSIHRVITVHVGPTVPATDVVFTVDANGAGTGVHATNAYRFGRPEPKLAQPSPGQGPALSAKGIKLGKPIKGD